LIEGLENPRFYKQKVGEVHGGVWQQASAKILITGHNPDAAASGLREACTVDKPLAIISLGFGTALNSSLLVGDIVVCHEFKNAIGVGSRLTAVSLPDKTTELLRYVLKTLPDLRGKLGSVVTVFDPVRDPGEKYTLFQRTQCDVVDQSAISIANIAEEFNLPFVVVRCIFDLSDEKLPEIDHYVRQKAKLSTTRLLGKLALNPGSFFTLRDLVGRAKTCRRKLDIFIDAFWKAIKTRREENISLSQLNRPKEESRAADQAQSQQWKD
jgi:nucleoside phosphorylase